MKKNPDSKSGIFNPRVLLGCLLCSAGVWLAMLSLAAPPASRVNPAAGVLKPVVIKSVLNGVSPAVRDLPKGVSTGPREVEHGLLRVKPNRPVPAGFVDQAVQKAVQNALAAPAGPTPNATFEGQGSVDSGGGPQGCLCVPPDPNGAIGPTQYVQMVNTVFSVYDRAGTRLTGPTPINHLFNGFAADNICRTANNGDPIVVYDQLSDRWLLSQFAFPFSGTPSAPAAPSDECVAISKGPDATGEYYIYDFHLSNANLEDYPHIGVWPDAYYMTTHEFNFAGLAYVGQAAWAFERDRMLKGQPAQMLYFPLGQVNSAFGGQLPANLDGFTLPPAGTPNYFAEVDTATDIPPTAALRIWKFHVDWSNPMNSSFGVAGQPNSITPVTNFARPNCDHTAFEMGCVPQLGDSFQLDPIGDRLMYRLAYRNFGNHESLVLNHTVIADATTGQMGPRWYEVRDPGGTPTIFQQSTWGPISQTDLLYRWMSSVAMDSAGDMAIGYSTSSQINFPSIAYAGRLAGDPVNTLGAEAQLFAGTGPQHGQIFAPQFGRWGDYSDLTVDPIDDCTFWYTNEYYAATDAPAGIWHTRVGSFKFPQCTPRPIGFLLGTVTDSATSNPIAGATVTAGGYTAITNPSGFYQFSPLAPGAYTDTASATGYFSSSPTGVTVTNGGNTVQNFALARNLAVPTPTPPPALQTINPPVLNSLGGPITTNSYTLTWSPAEVTTNLASYVVEESTDYVNPLFDNADGTAAPGQAGSLWTTGTNPILDPGNYPWIINPTYHNSAPNSYEAPGEDGGFAFGLNSRLTLISPITIPAGVGSGRLTFYSRYYNDPDDTGNIEISTDGGSNWSSLRVLTDLLLSAPANTRMQNHEIDLTAYKGTPFLLRFRFDGGPTVNIIAQTLGWWVDDINVDGATWKQIGTTGPSTTSLNITNKPNGHYYYRVRGTYTDGSSTNHSNVQGIVVNFPLTSVDSVMTHGNGGPTFPVHLLVPTGSPRGVECRSSTSLGGGNYTMVFKFPNNLVSVGVGSPNAATVTGHDPMTAMGSVSSSMIDSSDHHNYIVNLTNVSTGQYITVTLNSVLDMAGNSGNVTGPQMGVLIGDVNFTGLVDGNDVAAVQGHTRQTATSMNFPFDVNATGLIDGNDVALTQGKTRTSLPSPP